MHRRLLITGVPGTGKTTVGNALHEKYGYLHIDMESGNYINQISLNQKLFIDGLVRNEGDIVVTWGFVPSPEQVAIVTNFRSKGFKFIWFDGDRDAARREYIKRDTRKGQEYLKESLVALDLQMDRIDKSNFIDSMKPSIINTFTKSHNFKSIDSIIREIMELNKR